jgi:hypothetical protein
MARRNGRLDTMAGGRPKKWDSPEALQKDIDRYWAYCKDENKPPTIAGLAYYTNVDRHTIYNYAEKDEFFHIIKKAREYILMTLEEESIVNGKAGTIFVMKQYGYTDKHEVDSRLSGDFTEQIGRLLTKL